MISRLISNGLSGLLAVCLLFLSTGQGRADAIDGNWCNESGMSVQIDGPAIITPGGKSMTGEYSRHGFTYIAPENEEYSGKTLRMTIYSDDDMTLFYPDGKSEDWHRCRVTS